MTPTQTDTLALDAAAPLRLTFAEPDGVVRGGLVVLHETDGVTDGVRYLLTSLASEGWLAAAPHLYDAGRAAGGGQDLLDATDMTLDWLRERKIPRDLLGVMGFDLGGTAALVVAASRRLGAAVSIGGLESAGDAGSLLDAEDGPTDIVQAAAKLSCPWLGIYGDDGSSDAVAEVERLRDAASSARIATELVRYSGASHRFDNDPDAAAEAWLRTLNWFDAHLR